MVRTYAVLATIVCYFLMKHNKCLYNVSFLSQQASLQNEESKLQQLAST